MANRKTRFDSKVFVINDLATEATKRLPRHIVDYFNGGAGDMTTLLDNVAAYDRYKLRPRVLRDVENLDTSTELFGSKVTFPLGFAPSAAHKMAHPDGEAATSRAAAKFNIPMCLSSWSTTSLEDVKLNATDNPYAVQISFLKDVTYVERIIHRAEKVGYKALFVSVDLPCLGNRLNECRNDFKWPAHVTFPHLLEADGTSTPRSETPDLDYDPSISWDKIIPWLRERTKLEIWLKGVYTPEDVEMAIQHKVDGVIISNHGGRQLDGVPASLDALRDCAPIAADKIKIAIDGGIRRGSDIFKAIALGAHFCFVGRIPIWGLAYKGQEGVEIGISILLDEFRRTMMLTGCRSIRDITKEHLAILRTDGVLSKL